MTMICWKCNEEIDERGTSSIGYAIDQNGAIHWKCCDQPAPSAPQSTPDAPERIYLQWLGGPDDEAAPREHTKGMECLWCQDKLSGDDVEYVRADLASSRVASLQQEVERLTDANEQHGEEAIQSDLRAHLLESKLSTLTGIARELAEAVIKQGICGASYCPSHPSIQAALEKFSDWEREHERGAGGGLTK